MGKPKRTHDDPCQPDLFTQQNPAVLSHTLAGKDWPDTERFPVNHASTNVRKTVWADLVSSPRPLIVAGYSSIGEIIDFVATWDRGQDTSQARVVLGTQPFPSTRRHFLDPTAEFTEHARDHWLDQGISLRLSSKVIGTMQALDEGRLDVRVVAGEWALHSKIYVGEDAATLGSSNFTGAGLGKQVEANARFDRHREPARYRETSLMAENTWEVGVDWNEEFRALLNDLLLFVPWQAALARACADLLEGEWASRYLPNVVERQRLWPSQVTGIAQALWVIDNVGSVLVADATGSGKTRMGAHLTHAVRDRLYQTGRVRRDLAVLVAPPNVRLTWEKEAIACGLSLKVVSHGKLSRAEESLEADSVEGAQILALDESHNFLNRTSNRTQKVVENSADHVLLFTATPISKGAKDLLAVVQLLGADNFEDATIDNLRELEKRPNAELSKTLADNLREEIQRFTVRRTKATLNTMVDREPDAYADPITGRVNRYPDHESKTYPTMETEGDREVATRIRELAKRLRGLALLGRRIQRPVGSTRGSDDVILDRRLGAAVGLAAHHVSDSMRSSRAALLEHVAGTTAACEFEGIGQGFKSKSTGNMLQTVSELASDGPPEIDLNCERLDWLSSTAAWAEACEREVETYEQIQSLARQLSNAREIGKAKLLAEVQARHPRVIAFDHHPITLAVLMPLVREAGASGVLMATGSTNTTKSKVERALSREATGNALALCSDALNEGLNLQGASAIVHLDLQTTMRAVEQRVGRIERMDSLHESIQSWWPEDGPEFATRAAESLAARAEATRSLLGSNLVLPDYLTTQATQGNEIVRATDVISEFEKGQKGDWDGILDALEPVRNLVFGDDALLTHAEYEEHSQTRRSVVSRVSPLTAESAWVFLAFAGTQHGAPRWLLLEAENDRTYTRLDEVVGRLRELVADNPPTRTFDDACQRQLDAFLAQAVGVEDQLLPLRLAKSVRQMREITAHWRRTALNTGNLDLAARWERLSELANPSRLSDRADLYLVGQAWFDLVRPTLARAQREGGTKLVRLADIAPMLRETPLPVETVESAMRGIGPVPDFDTRIAACIIGVPG